MDKHAQKNGKILLFGQNIRFHLGHKLFGNALLVHSNIHKKGTAIHVPGDWSHMNIH